MIKFEEYKEYKECPKCGYKHFDEIEYKFNPYSGVTSYLPVEYLIIKCLKCGYKKYTKTKDAK